MRKPIARCYAQSHSEGHFPPDELTPNGGGMQPWFGLHLPSYTFPDSAARAPLRRRRRAGPRGRGRRLRPRHRDGPPLPDPGRRAGHRSHARGLVDACGARPRDDPGPPRHAGHRRDLPQPGVPRQDGHDAGRASPAAGRCWAWAPPGTRRSTRATGTSSRPFEERMDRLDEALTIIRAMFTRGPAELRRPPLPDRTRRSTSPTDPARRPARSWSAAAGSSEPCGSPRSTPT